MAWSNEGSRQRTTTPAHRARRLRVLARDNYTCQIRGPHCTTTAVHCDHIRNVLSFPNPADAESDSNCQAACIPCHGGKTAQEGNAALAAKRARLKLPTEQHPGIRSTGHQSPQ